MKRKSLFHKFSRKLAIIILSGALLLSGCTSGGGSAGAAGTESQALQASKSSADVISTAQVQADFYATQATAGEVTTIDVSDMFSDRDQRTEYKESECALITLNGKEATCDSKAVSISDQVILIKEEGSYILRGTYEGSVRVEAPEDAKVQLILENAEIHSESTAAIYVKTADKVFLTMAEGSSNKILNDGDFIAIDDNNVDGAIYAKSDLTLNGNGTLSVSSKKGHGVVSKDDLKITGGIYEITAGDHGISGKDSIRIAGGFVTITSANDGLHSGNDEDADKGYVYVANGTITILAGDDGIHGESKVVIAGGTINVEKCYEGIEASIVEIAGGYVNVTSSDDGINASDGSGSEEFRGFGGRGNFGQGSTQQKQSASNNYVLISGGKVNVDAGGDGIDSNGDLFVSGGEVFVSGPEGNMNSAIDYDGTGRITGGSVIAIGSTGMAMNFNDATQGSVIVSASSTHNAGELVQLKDKDGNVIASITSTRKYTSVVVSSPLMKQGETYTLAMGGETKTITLDQLIYGQSSGFGPGGENGFENKGGRSGRGALNGNLEGRPEMPEGYDGSLKGRPEMPEGYDGSLKGRPEMPEGFDGNLEGRPEMPEGFDGNLGGRPQQQERQNGKTES